jgi:hypothetical protein
MAKEESLSTAGQEAATALSAAIKQSKQAVEQVLGLAEPDRRACLRWLRETGLAQSWVRLSRLLLDAANPLNPHRQLEHEVKALKNARRMDRAMLRRLKEKFQPKRGMETETKEKAAVIDKLKNEGRKWSEIIAVLERDHSDWLQVKSYRRHGRTPETYERIRSWARTTYRRYREWKNSI